MTGTDLGIFTQSIWTTIFEGKFFFNSIEFLSHNGVTSHFGVHVSPILILLIPGYAIYQGPETLLIYQSIFLGLGALPIYVTAKRMLGNPSSLVISLIYFLYPALHGVNFSNFHELAFLPLFLGIFFYGYLFKKNFIILISGILCLCVKEDISLIIIAACLVELWVDKGRIRKENWVIVFLLIVSIIWLFLAFTTVMPAFTQENETITTTFLTQYYEGGGISASEILPRIQYMFLLFAPLLLIPFISPEIMVIAIPSFFEILLSPMYFNIEYQYSALVISPIFFATILSLGKIQKRCEEKKRYNLILFLLLMSGIISCLVVSPVIQAFCEDNHDEIRADSAWFKEGISVIPSDASISTQANLVSFFANRPLIYHEYVQNVDYIVIWEKFKDSIIFKKDLISIIQTYRCIYKNNGFYIFKLKTLE